MLRALYAVAHPPQDQACQVYIACLTEYAVACKSTGGQSARVCDRHADAGWQCHEPGPIID